MNVVRFPTRRDFEPDPGAWNALYWHAVDRILNPANESEKTLAGLVWLHSLGHPENYPTPGPGADLVQLSFGAYNFLYVLSAFRIT